MVYRSRDESSRLVQLMNAISAAKKKIETQGKEYAEAVEKGSAGQGVTTQSLVEAPAILGTQDPKEHTERASKAIGGRGGAQQQASLGAVVYRSYHALVERDDVEAGRTCPRAKAGPVKAPEPAIPAASATPVNTQGFTIVSIGGYEITGCGIQECKTRVDREQKRAKRREYRKNSLGTPSLIQGPGDTTG